MLHASALLFEILLFSGVQFVGDLAVETRTAERGVHAVVGGVPLDAVPQPHLPPQQHEAAAA